MIGRRSFPRGPTMPNDARLGLAIGVALVILVGIVVFHRDSTAAPTTPAATIRDDVTPAPAPPPTAERNKTPAKSTSRTDDLPATFATRSTPGEPNVMSVGSNN